MYPLKSAQEIEQLKHNWLSDPCYDLEDVPGFEAYRDELAAWRRAQAFAQQKAEQKRLRDKADNLNCSVALVKYIESLERTVQLLQEFHAAHYYGDTIPFPHYPPRRP